MSWESAWREGRTGWDAGAAAPSLVDLIERGEVSGPGRALVPGCGSGYDALALAEAGLEVIGLDLAPTALERFHALRDARGIAPERARGVAADFFEWEAPEGGFDVVWDYTFLCAIDPSQREDWAAKMRAIVVPGGELITLVFPIERITGPDREGPPFQLKPGDVRALLEPEWEAVELAPVPKTLSHPGRVGLEWLGRWRLRSA